MFRAYAINCYLTAVNCSSHQIALEGELAAIIERLWQARVYQTPNGPGISNYVFDRDGKPIGDNWRRL